MNLKKLELIPKNVKTISFDMDGVLIKTDFDDYIWNVLLPKEYSKKKKIKLNIAKKEVFEAYKKAMGINEWTSLSYWFKKFQLEKDYKKLLIEAKKKLYFYKDISVLNELKNKYNLILITQSPFDFIDVKIPNLKKYFSKIYSSPDSFQSLKKEENVYKKILKENKLQPYEILHIGDNLKFDYIIPNKIGINVLFLDRKHKFNNNKIKSIKTLKSLRICTSSF